LNHFGISDICPHLKCGQLVISPSGHRARLPTITEVLLCTLQACFLDETILCSFQIQTFSYEKIELQLRGGTSGLFRPPLPQTIAISFSASLALEIVRVEHIFNLQKPWSALGMSWVPGKQSTEQDSWGTARGPQWPSTLWEGSAWVGGWAVLAQL
jgi:hypothetical protein